MVIGKNRFYIWLLCCLPYTLILCPTFRRKTQMYTWIEKRRVDLSSEKKAKNTRAIICLAVKDDKIEADLDLGTLSADCTCPDITFKKMLKRVPLKPGSESSASEMGADLFMVWVVYVNSKPICYPMFYFY